MAQMTNPPAGFPQRSELTGVFGIHQLDHRDRSHLLPIRELNGGGLHSIRRGGYLDIHTDFNFHPTTKKNRRLNLLFYLNED